MDKKAIFFIQVVLKDVKMIEKVQHINSIIVLQKLIFSQRVYPDFFWRENSFRFA